MQIKLAKEQSEHMQFSEVQLWAYSALPLSYNVFEHTDGDRTHDLYTTPHLHFY